MRNTILENWLRNCARNLGKTPAKREIIHWITVLNHLQALGVETCEQIEQVKAASKRLGLLTKEVSVFLRKVRDHGTGCSVAIRRKARSACDSKPTTYSKPSSKQGKKCACSGKSRSS